MFVENRDWLLLPGMMNDEYHLPVLGSCGGWRWFACFLLHFVRSRNDG